MADAQQGQPQEQVRFAELDVRRRLASAATQLFEALEAREICKLVTKPIAALAGDAIVAITEFAARSRTVTVRALECTDEERKRTTEILGREPVGLSFEFPDELRRSWTPGELQPLPGRVFELFFGQIPRPTCDELEAALGIGEVHAMACAYADDILGTVAILMRGREPLHNRPAIEALVAQAGLALKRARAEEALRESEARYRALVETMPEALVVHRDGVVLFANAAALKLYGIASLAELGSKTLYDIVPPSDRAATEADARAVQAGKRVALTEYRLCRASGEEAFVEVAAVPVAFRGEPAVQILAHDITERKRMERELRESRTRYQALVETNADFIWEVDFQGRYMYCSPQMERLWGMKAEALIGKTPFDFMPPEARDAALERFRNMVQSPEPFTALETTALDAQGNLVLLESRGMPFFDDGGKLLGFRGTTRDVTAQKLAADALRESEERLRVLIESSSQAVWETNAQGVVVVPSPSYCAYTGLRAEQVMGYGWLDAVHPDDRASVEREWRDAVTAGRNVDAAFRIRSRDGAFRWTNMRAAPLRHADGRVAKWAAMNLDITDRKRAEEALREADRRKNHFLAVLSHELRNPLMPIKNALYILERTAPESDEARRAKDVITRQIDQLSHLVDDLLDVTRVTRGKIQLQRRRVELNELVRRTIEDHRALFDRSAVALAMEAMPNAVFVDADGSRIAQVVSNLLQNAAKFTPRGGRVTVTISREASSRQAVVRVADTGAGMTPELLGRIFEPFMQADETLDRSKGGLGLGLALVKGLVEQHGGSIEAKSAGPGRGSEFVVRLPLDTSAPEAPERGYGPASKMRRRVLVIDDNADAADTLKTMLELDGHDVAVAYDGAEGVAKARELHPDVVLCDIGLPGMDGYAVARTLRSDAALREAHLVALTGYALPEDLERAAEAGFERHLAKPPSRESLEALL